MKNLLIVVLNFGFIITLGTLYAQDPNVPKGFTQKQEAKISFTENKGQVYDQNFKARPDVLFGGTDGKLVFHLRSNGICYQLNRVDSWKEQKDLKVHKNRKVVDKNTIYRIDINWLNSNVNADVIKHDPTEGYTNYYLESCPNGALNVKSYKKVEYQNLYIGINLKWYQKDGQLKYDYIVAPHADYKNIQLEVKGATLQLQKDGSLLLKTPLGQIQEQAPIVFQSGKKLNAKYVLKNNVVSFNIDNYDANQELIIDPAVRLWGTYYGGTGTDQGESCSTDASGNVYLSGQTGSGTGTIIATSGAHQTNFNGSVYDAFLVKFNSSGVRQWGTYYGGSGLEYGYECVTDASGNVYLSGSTTSNASTIIATPGSQQPNYAGGVEDAFLVKFNSSGVRQWGTYYGSTGTDFGFSCATDASGNIYLAGSSSSTTSTLIATVGSHQASFGGGTTNDCFLAKFNAVGVRQWGTYYGGSGDDVATSCATDALGNIYITGLTGSNSGTVIATSGAHQTTYAGSDAFLVQFNSNGVRQWGTYYGGSGLEWGQGCSTDASGNIYLAGYTASGTTTLIATVGSHQASFGGGTNDAFLAKFNNSGVRQWGTYYGTSGDDRGYSCATDASGNVFLAGYAATSSGTIIATTGSHQSSFGGGTYDAFLAKFNSSGVRQIATYYGGLGNDFGNSCASGLSNIVYLTGYTDTPGGTAIATVGSHQSTGGGGTWDPYLVQFISCLTPSQPTSISGQNTLCSANGATTYSTATVAGATSYSWSLPGGWIGTSTSNTISATPGSSGIMSVTAINACGTSSAQTLSVTVNPTPTISVNSGAICSGSSFTISPTGASTYTIQGGNAIVSPTANTSYTVIGTSTAGCVSNTFATSNITVNPLPTISASTNNSLICVGQMAVLTASGATSYTWNPGGSGASINVSPTVTANYTITGVDANGCSNTTIFTQNVSGCAGITTISNSTADILLFPNPTSNKIYVRSPVKALIKIYNCLGKLLVEQVNNSGEIEIDLEQFAKGIYLVQINSLTYKLIKN